MTTPKFCPLQFNKETCRMAVAYTTKAPQRKVWVTWLEVKPGDGNCEKPRIHCYLDDNTKITVGEIDFDTVNRDILQYAKSNKLDANSFSTAARLLWQHKGGFTADYNTNKRTNRAATAPASLCDGSKALKRGGPSPIEASPRKKPKRARSVKMTEKEITAIRLRFQDIATEFSIDDYKKLAAAEAQLHDSQYMPTTELLVETRKIADIVGISPFEAYTYLIWVDENRLTRKTKRKEKARKSSQVHKSQDFASLKALLQRLDAELQLWNNILGLDPTVNATEE